MLEAWFLLSGRLGRLAYFGYAILISVILLVLMLIFILPTRNSPNGPTVMIVVAVFFGLIGLWAGACLGVKRLYDLDMSGWHYAWMVLVPAVFNGLGQAMHSIAIRGIGGVISLGVGLYLLFWPGTDGPNSFGYQP